MKRALILLLLLPFWGRADDRALVNLALGGVLRPNTDAGDFRTAPQPFPEEHGSLVLKVRMRSASGTAKMNIHLVGDNYAWRQTREVDVATVPQTFSVEGEMPRSVSRRNEFFARLDLPKIPVFVESLTVAWRPIPQTPSDGREKLVNADFAGGAWGFLRYFSRTSPSRRARRAVVADGRARPDHTSFRSFCHPIVPGRDYTVAARVRNLDPSSPAEVCLMLIDNAWQVKQKRQTLSDADWHDVRFTCQMKPSRYNRAYVRIDTGKGSDIEIDRLSLAEGRLDGFPPFVDGEIVPAGPNLFDAGKPGVFAVRRRNVSGRAGKTPLSVIDARGRVVRQLELAYGPEVFSEARLEISADHPRGLFEVEAPGVPRLRYAIAENLSGRRFAFNPHGGHYYPNDFKDLSWYDRYIPIVGGGNRAFCAKVDYPRDQDYMAAVDALGVDSILTMPDFKTFFCTGECPWTDDVKRDYFAQSVEVARRFAGHRVFGVELFNEPFLWRIRTGPEAGRKTMRGSKVAQIHAETVPLIRAANPDLKVIGPCCALKEPEYLEEFLKAGGGAYVDGISVHTYTADPDTDDFAGRYRDLRKMVAKYVGRDLPVYNTEAYFGVRGSPCTLNDDEAQRGYFRESEWSHAGVVVAQVVNHAAEQVSWCDFAPEYILSGLTESEQTYPYAALPALNAAIGFLADAGGGREIPLMPGVRAFLFEKAAGGPLVTLRSRIDAPVAVRGLSGARVFDVFGNPLPDVDMTLQDEVVYLRFASAAEAETRLGALEFSGLEEIAARERPLPVATVKATYSSGLSFDAAPAIHLGRGSLSRVHTPGLTWRGEDDCSADVRIVWNETGLRLRVDVMDDRAVYPDSPNLAYKSDSLQVYFDQRNDATPASEEAGRRREDDIVYNVAALDGGERPVAYVSFANGSRYLGAANETTGVDSDVDVEYAHADGRHVYKVFFPASVFPDFKIAAGAKMGFSMAVNDTDEPNRRGQALVLSSPGAEPYLHAHEYLDLEFVK